MLIRFSALIRSSAAIITFALLIAVGAQSFAQTGPVLNANYYNYITSLNLGQYNIAEQGFTKEARGSMKIGASGRFLDAVCHYAMLGETYYRQGQLEKANGAFSAALNYYMDYPNWLANVQFPASLASRPYGQIPWGKRLQGTNVATIPTNITLMIGEQVTEQTIARGGAINPPKLIGVPVAEILRCVVLSIKRRCDILGPLSEHDKLNNTVVEFIQKNPGLPNHWSSAWQDAQYGAALRATGNKGQAVAILKRSLALGGELDHPLTPYAFEMLGQMAFEDGRYDEANTYFTQATIVAGEYGDAAILEEAFRYAAIIQLMKGTKGEFRELEPAAGWAKRADLRELHASLLVLAAESAAVNQSGKKAAALLAEANSRMIRSPMLTGDIGARWNYVNAMLSYQSGDVAAGDKAFATCLKIADPHSKWNYQLNRTIDMSASGLLSKPKTVHIFERLALDPFANDWAERPIETMSYLIKSRQALYDAWFETIFAESPERAFEIADMAKRHRFFNSLPFGGRLMAIRWLLTMPEEALDQSAKVQRQELLGKFPQFVALNDTARKITSEIDQLPLAPDQGEIARKQSDLMIALQKTSNAQEVLIREMALRREPTQLAFPPVVKTKEIIEQLPQGHVALLSHVTLKGHIYAMLLSKTRYVNWRVENPSQFQKKMSNVLKMYGNFDGNREIQPSQLKDESWKTATMDALNTFLHKSKLNFAQQFDELVIVPDDLLWYFPWEAAQVGDPKASIGLLSKTRIRYAPTMGLVFRNRAIRGNDPRIGTVVGKIHPKIDAKMMDEDFQKLSAKIAAAKRLKAAQNAPSALFGTTVDQLVVLDDLAGADKAPFDWVLLNLDRSGSANIANWMSLPKKRTDVVVLPGFHTSAESMGRDGRAGNGNEIFLSVLGLMSQGARTVVLTRWRTGGANSMELVTNFLQELPFNNAAESWQRSVKLSQNSPLTLDQEPRVQKSKDAPELDASHPFFWSQFIVIDSGVLGSHQEEPAANPMAAAPVANPQPGANPAPGAAPVAPPSGNANPGAAGLPALPALPPDPNPIKGDEPKADPMAPKEDPANPKPQEGQPGGQPKEVPPLPVPAK